MNTVFDTSGLCNRSQGVGFIASKRVLRLGYCSSFANENSFQIFYYRETSLLKSGLKSMVRLLAMTKEPEIKTLLIDGLLMMIKKDER